MKRIITFGTYDLLHIGHINIFRRARELGDYLIAGISTDALNYSKKQKISKAINQFCTLNEKYDDYFPRFDIMVVEVMDLIPKFIHFENIELNC